MPTGYTEIIEEGCTFEEYVWRCATAFGPGYDRPLDAPFEELKVEPDPYYVEQLAKAKKRYAQLSNMTLAEKLKFGSDRRVADIASARASLAGQRAKYEKYKDMREQVAAWQPPSKEHEGLKNFMLQQIDLCSSDTDFSYWERHLADAENSNPMDYHTKALESAQRDIDYYNQQEIKDLGRSYKRSSWIEQLMESVPMPEALKPKKR